MDIDEIGEDGQGDKSPQPIGGKSKDEIILTFMDREYVALRREIESIRRCQTTYFWSSLAATSAVIGLASQVFSAIAYFAGLLIIAPMWCIYFDKTSILLRITAYIRVLEKMIINFEQEKNFFCGFETYNKILRKKTYDDYNSFDKKDKTLTERILNRIDSAFFVENSGLSAVINFKMPNQTIYLVWLIYFLISSFCFFLGMYATITSTMTGLNYIITVGSIILIATFVFLFSLTYTLYVVGELVNGKRRSLSYREDECFKLLEENYLQNYI